MLSVILVLPFVEGLVNATGYESQKGLIDLSVVFISMIFGKLLGIAIVILLINKCVAPVTVQRWIDEFRTSEMYNYFLNRILIESVVKHGLRKVQ